MEPSRKTITLVLTERCNFACKYCNLLHKNPRRMPFAVARAAIDYITARRDLFDEEVAIWELIGGEPLLEVALIDRIIEYVRQRTYELAHPWFSHSWFSMSSNGWLYDSDPVQRLIRRYGNQLEISITIDGPRHVHDAERVLPDGSGTYDRVAANVPLWLEQHPRASTKVTISHSTLPNVAESILHLFSLGIRQVNANVVFENVWRPGDDEIFERQLDLLGEAMTARGLYPRFNCSLFNRTIGRPYDPSHDINWCGSGKMLAVDVDGNFYPCNRFVAFSLARQRPRAMGSVRDGTASAQSPQECLECEVASGCAWCQGFNYDQADTPTIYQRATYICAMHRARVRANRRFWARVAALEHGTVGGEPLSARPVTTTA